MQHAINWFEIPVADLERAMKFYGAMTNTPLQREAFGPPGEEMAIFKVDTRRHQRLPALKPGCEACAKWHLGLLKRLAECGCLAGAR
jgi:hypothetical protein